VTAQTDDLHWCSPRSASMSAAATCPPFLLFMPPRLKPGGPSPATACLVLCCAPRRAPAHQAVPAPRVQGRRGGCIPFSLRDDTAHERPHVGQQGCHVAWPIEGNVWCWPSLGRGKTPATVDRLSRHVPATAVSRSKMPPHTAHARTPHASAQPGTVPRTTPGWPRRRQR
jgi:hypothetical protein